MQTPNNEALWTADFVDLRCVNTVIHDKVTKRAEGIKIKHKYSDVGEWYSISSNSNIWKAKKLKIISIFTIKLIVFEKAQLQKKNIARKQSPKAKYEQSAPDKIYFAQNVGEFQQFHLIYSSILNL